MYRLVLPYDTDGALQNGQTKGKGNGVQLLHVQIGAAVGH